MNRKLDAYDNGESPHDALRHDDPLGNELHGASQPPMDDVDWMALHARIRRAAEPALAARAQALAETARPLAGIAASSNVWQPLAGWSPFGIPLAAAATVILMIGAARVGTEPVRRSDTGSFRTIEEEFVIGLGGNAAPLVAGIGSEDMLDAVLFYDGEDWQP
jgi:hypothetical protein